MKKLLLILLCLPMIGLGQGWEQTYLDGWSGMDIVECSDGSFIVAAISEKLLKIDENGEIIWSINLEGFNIVELKKVNDTKIAALGINMLAQSEEEVLDFKLFDEDGNIDWSINLGVGTADFLNQLDFIQDNDNNFVIASLGNGEPSYNDGFFLYKVSPEGSLIFEKNYSWVVDRDGGGCSIIQLSNNNFLIGLTKMHPNDFGEYNSNSDRDFFIIQTNVYGDTIFTKNYNQYGNQQLTCILQDSNNDIILTGYNSSESGFINHQYRKIDVNGNNIILQNYSINSDQECYEIILSNEDDYVFAGYKTNNLTNLDFFIRRTDIDGNIIFENSFDNNLGNDVLVSIIKSSDNGYLLTGMSEQYIYIVKTNSQGSVTSKTEIPLPNPNRKLDKTIDILGKETKPQPNTPLIEIYDDGTVEKKVIIE